MSRFNQRDIQGNRRAHASKKKLVGMVSTVLGFGILSDRW